MARSMSGRQREWASVETLLCTAAETDCTGLGAPVVRQELNQGVLFSSPIRALSVNLLCFSLSVAHFHTQLHGSCVRHLNKTCTFTRCSG
ncbi:hypothetical protein ACN38_g12989 [Penicillium nordicum]|uniref:Uncharacterized protein n=1 Tax=Penicillium nordicum TaxID=229535 RepID=A0A0M9W9E3_9EURO|nr:hypothetical protein ACN38_g12989 [Penicillium nordicum]